MVVGGVLDVFLKIKFFLFRRDLGGYCVYFFI